MDLQVRFPSLEHSIVVLSLVLGAALPHFETRHIEIFIVHISREGSYLVGASYLSL